MKNFKKPFAVFAAFALTVSLLAGCGGSESSRHDTSATVADSTAQTESSAPATQAPSADDPQIKALMDDSVSTYGFKGVAYVTKNGSAVYSSGDINSPYRVASVSKQFTSAAVLMLYEEGKLDINSTIDKYFPEYAHGGEITISQLMNMCSGIPDYITLADAGAEYAESAYGISTENTSEQNREIIKSLIFAQDLLFTPGSENYYCNTNYLLLAEIVTQVSGTPYESFITERMFKPLGMNSTGFGDTWSGEVTGDDIGDWYKYKGLCYGCADMISTAADLEKWGEEFIVNKLLSDNIITLMTTDYLGGYGYGITPDMGDGFVYHDGNLPPYCSTLSVNRSKGLVLVLLDCDYSSPLLSMRHDIFTAVTQLED